MNKYINLLAFLSLTTCVSHVAAVDPFEKLMPGITRNAQTFVESIDTLTQDMQLAYLNLFVLQLEESVPALIKCMEYIESQPEMLPSYKKFTSFFIEPIQRYVENCQTKISRKTNLTPEQEESLWQKLETKIQELVAYINKIYYEIVYNYILQKNSSSAVYMFDENGVIPQEKRTKLLPRPE